MEIVLLAAGMGLRLGHLTRVHSKAMVSLGDRLLIDYTLPNLLAHEAVDRVWVVGGFEFEALKMHLKIHYRQFGKRLKLLENKKFTLSNIFSIKLVLEKIKKSFLICNVDHLYTVSTWFDILESAKGFSIYCDFKRLLADDEMKVELDDPGNLVQMSKTLLHFHGGYVGLTHVPQEKMVLYKEGVEEVVDQYGEKGVVENVLPLLAKRGEKIVAHPFDHHVWYEVDTPQDLKKAELAIVGLKDAGQILSMPQKISHQAGN